MDTFENDVLPDYVETRPKLEIQLERGDMPKEPAFGYICVPGRFNVKRATLQL